DAAAQAGSERKTSLPRIPLRALPRPAAGDRGAFCRAHQSGAGLHRHARGTRSPCALPLPLPRAAPPKARAFDAVAAAPRDLTAAQSLRGEEVAHAARTRESFVRAANVVDVDGRRGTPRPARFEDDHRLGVAVRAGHHDDAAARGPFDLTHQAAGQATLTAWTRQPGEAIDIDERPVHAISEAGGVPACSPDELAQSQCVAR